MTDTPNRVPEVGDEFPLSGTVQVLGWEVGDNLRLLEYVETSGMYSHIALCANITRGGQDYIDTDHL